jgi:hypothetical protein
MLDKFKDSYVLVDGLRSPGDIVKLAYTYGYRKVVSIYEVLALYDGVAPT